jgi:pyrimidine-nucleoside phosphorylase
MTTPGSLLRAMRTGKPQTTEQIESFVAGVVDGTVTRPQAAAWLAWAFSRGLTDDETVALTRAMTASGDVLQWPEGAPLIDKHSTGGVGDKVSLVLAPLWAELGFRVPMISGRGLGHTGGTLDKLEAIPGFRTDLSTQELGAQLESVGCFISGQTAEIAPCDGVLYALRNETSTVESIPLIVASILSKKLAEGVERLTLDVKTGSGAFMPTTASATALAQALVRVAQGAGLQAQALVTAMDRPLGQAVGNALEVTEAAACLQGGGPDDLRELVVGLADHPRAAEVLASGAAYGRFERMVRAQGGDTEALSRGLAQAPVQTEIHATAYGTFVADAMAVGRLAFALGAGREAAGESIDPAVGVVLVARPGAKVQQGDVLAVVHAKTHDQVRAAAPQIGDALRVADAAPPLLPMVVDRIS